MRLEDADLRKRKHTTVFQLVQLAGIMGTMYICMVLSGSIHQGLSVCNFFGPVRGVCAEPYDRTVSLAVYKGKRARAALGFGQYEPCVK